MAYFDSPTDRATEVSIVAPLQKACVEQLAALEANPLLLARPSAWVEVQVSRALRSEARALRIAERMAGRWRERLEGGVPLGEVYAEPAGEGDDDWEEEEEEA